MSVTDNNPNVHSSKCTLNSSGTQALATGRFRPSAFLPVNAKGQQEGRLQLQLEVTTSQSFLGHKDVGVGENYEGVSVGETSWRIETAVERFHDLRPTRCVVSYEIFGVP